MEMIMWARAMYTTPTQAKIINLRGQKQITAQMLSVMIICLLGIFAIIKINYHLVRRDGRRAVMSCGRHLSHSPQQKIVQTNIRRVSGGEQHTNTNHTGNGFNLIFCFRFRVPTNCCCTLSAISISFSCFFMCLSVAGFDFELAFIFYCTLVRLWSWNTKCC